MKAIGNLQSRDDITYPTSINTCTNKIKGCHDTHPTEAHLELLSFESMEYYAMNDENDCRESEAEVHCSTVRMKCWMFEMRVDSCYYTEESQENDLLLDCQLLSLF